jgi:hypothetical protein
MARDHSDLLAEAAILDGPILPPVVSSDLGGIDPLGLRQVNFDMMDQVLPGMNNVGRHIRPYTLVAWAFHRAFHLAREGGRRLLTDEIRDYVDRVEVLFAWSQFLRDPRADLPGRQVLSSILAAPDYCFGGPAWMKRRLDRRYSTALTAPITYGPALKTLGWVDVHSDHSILLVPQAEAMPAVLAFEARLSEWLNHPALSQLGEVTVSTDDVKGLGEAWRLDDPTPEERAFVARVLAGDLAPRSRRSGVERMIAVASQIDKVETAKIREFMTLEVADDDAELALATRAWRRLQARQLFRLALESLLFWLTTQLAEQAMHSEEIVERLVGMVGGNPEMDTSEWLDALRPSDDSPVPLMARISATFATDNLHEAPAAVFSGLAYALAEAPRKSETFERPDRLPLARAAADARGLADQPARQFVTYVLESWVLTQHIYWSVGRGLVDARARGKTLLRLKIVLDEDGWTLAPKVRPGSPPVATQDRLETAMTLATEAGLIERNTA